MTDPPPVSRQIRLWLTSAAIHGSSEDQRSSERNRRAVASALAGLLLRGSSFVVVLISIPLTLELLGSVRFGMWLTLASVVALLGATDLGIGNGVLNSVALAFGQGDREAARRYMASGLVALAGIAVAFGLLFLLIYPHIAWDRVYNVANNTLASSEAGPATAIFVATFLVALPLGLVGQVRYAFQEGFAQSLFAGLGNGITLVLLVVAVWARAGLPLLVLAMTTGPIIASAINFSLLIKYQRPWLAPRRADITLAATRSVVGVGLAFMVLQIAYAVAFSSDRLVVAQVVGPAAVADYSVVYRLFAIPAALASIAMLPLWPAYREALSRSDLGWVRRTLRRSLVIVLVATVPLAIALALVGPAIIDWWTKGVLSPVYSLYPAFGAFTIAFAVANVYSVLLNGAQALRFQISTWIVMAILNISVSIYLATRVGVTGVAYGSLLATVAVLIVPAALYVPRLLGRFERAVAR